MTDIYVLVHKGDGADVLHRNPREECNTDDAEKKERIDEFSASSLQSGGHTRLCQHCYPEEA